MEDDGSSVRVAVRVRPLIGHEKVEQCDECVSVLTEESQIIMGQNRSFTYDYTFSKYAQQSDIWYCVEPLVKSSFDGYNATIFAYGQTGSGKTYTMGSGSSVNIEPEEYGIIPRVIAAIFEQIETIKKEHEQKDLKYSADVKIRFLEVYGEEVRDLLWQYDGQVSDCRVNLRESEIGEVQVVGATEENVENVQECMKLLERGTLSRTTGSTLMNAHSSRSHAIFTLTLAQHMPVSTPDVDMTTGDDETKPTSETEMEMRTSSFNFVDLAGSERQKRTQAEGKRLKEGIDINKGLLALGNVISALGDDKKRGKVHVPYRDSKLTRMLQDSLGGNSRTLMLACVSPADVNFEETLNALKYANRARNIKNKPVVNRDERSSTTAALRHQVALLQAEVHRLRNPGLSESELKMSTVGTNYIGVEGVDFDSYGQLRLRAETSESEVARLTSELKRLRSQMDSLKEEMITAQSERDYLRLCVEEQVNSETNTNLSPEEREQKTNILKEHLRTISDLQEKLRQTESERDRIARSGRTAMKSYAFMSDSHIPMPKFEANIGEEVIQQAEKAIEKESEILKKLQQEAQSEGQVQSDELSHTMAENKFLDDEMHNDNEFDDEDSLMIGNNDDEADYHRVFQRRQDHLNASVENLAHDISMKEQLVQSIRAAQENFERMRTYYEQKMAQMMEEVQTVQSDRDHLVHEIELHSKSHEPTSASYSPGKAVRLEKLNQDLKTKDSELLVLRRKQNEMNKFMTQNNRKEMQLRVLNAEISNMKRQKVELVKKMQAERKRYEQEANRRKREIMSLKRASNRDKQALQRLGNQKEAQERVLKRKMEEIQAHKMRYKQQQQLHLAASKKQNRQRQKKLQRLQENAWLSEQVKKRALEQQKLEQLRAEREAVATEMALLCKQRQHLEEELKQRSNNLLGDNANIRDVLMTPIKDATQKEKESSSGPEPSKEEEEILQDLEERIEACQAQLEYKEIKISDLGGSLDVNDDDDDDLVAEATLKTAEQTLPEASTLLKMLFTMAVDVKKEDQRKEMEIAKLQVELTDVTRQMIRERERSQQLKQTFDKSLQRVVNTVSSSVSSSQDSMTSHEMQDDFLTLLSVAEERNAALQEQCGVLSDDKIAMEKENNALKQDLLKEQAALVECTKRIKLLEAEVGIPNSRFSASLRQDSEGENSIPRAFAEKNANREEGQSEGQPSHRTGIFGERDSDGDVDKGYAKNKFSRQEQSVSGGGNDSDTVPSTKSIFNRLSNPQNFTGIHKNRINEGISKRDVIANRSNKLRSRRMKDRKEAYVNIPVTSSSLSHMRTPKSRNTEGTPSHPLDQSSTSSTKLPASQKNSKSSIPTVFELAASNGEIEIVDFGQEPEEFKTDHDEHKESLAPPPPVDVYSRLAEQYTASAQSKRHKAPSTSTTRKKAKEGKDNRERTGSNSGDVEMLSESEGTMEMSNLKLSEHENNDDTQTQATINNNSNGDRMSENDEEIDGLLNQKKGAFYDQVHEQQRQQMSQQNK